MADCFVSAGPFHLLFWKVFFGDDPGIKSLCEASDFQKFVIVFSLYPFVSEGELYMCLCWLGVMLVEKEN